MTHRLIWFELLLGLVISGEGKAEHPCTVLLKPKTHSLQLWLTDLEEAFPEFQQKADKGVTVTLDHRVSIKGKSPELSYSFGCKVTFDLWNKRYAVVPTGLSSTSDPHLISSLGQLPEGCRGALLPGKNLLGNQELEIVSRLDPVSAELAEKTRSWLAERGVGSGSRALLGRAVASLIDLKEDKAVKRTCRIKAEL